ncbi:outer membrane lipoprotein-sorting protein [Planctomycetota bacterium]
MRRLQWSAAIVGALLVVGGEALALTGREIAERVDKQNQAADEAYKSELRVIHKTGVRRSYTMLTKFKAGEGNDDKVLIRFLLPQTVTGTGLLIVERGDSDSQWLYVPYLRKTKLIAGSSKGGSFMESDLSNYDMRTENLDGHEYKLVGEETVAERACYKLEATPKTDEIKEETGYARRLVYVDKERWVAFRTEYYDKDNKRLKLAVKSEYKLVGKLWRSSRLVVSNVQAGSKTMVIHDESSRKINEGVSDDEFTKRTLQNPLIK